MRTLPAHPHNTHQESSIGFSNEIVLIAMFVMIFSVRLVCQLQIEYIAECLANAANGYVEPVLLNSPLAATEGLYIGLGVGVEFQPRRHHLVSEIGAIGSKLRNLNRKPCDFVQGLPTDAAHDELIRSDFLRYVFLGPHPQYAPRSVFIYLPERQRSSVLEINAAFLSGHDHRLVENEFRVDGDPIVG